MNTAIWAALATVAAVSAAALVGFLLKRSGDQQTDAIAARLLGYEELEPASQQRRSGWHQAFEMADAAFQLAFGILCVELLAYLVYLYWNGAEGLPLARLVRPAYQNFLYLPGMLMIALGGVLGLRK